LVAGRESEKAEHKNERNNGVEHFDRHVVAQLHRQARLALATAVDDRRPNDQTPRDDADDEQHKPRRDPETDHAVDLVRGAGLGGQPAQLHLSRAARECHRGDEGERDRRQAKTSLGTHREPLVAGL